MTTLRKRETNRKNAKASTGPKSTEGRQRSSRNATRHGLNIPLSAHPAYAADVEQLARKIAGPKASADLVKIAKVIADAELDLQRVKAMRLGYLRASLDDPYFEPKEVTQAKVILLRRLLTKKLMNTPVPEFVENFLTSQLSSDKKLALALSLQKPARSLDRYEARARARRKRAVQEFEHAQRGSAG